MCYELIQKMRAILIFSGLCKNFHAYLKQSAFSTFHPTDTPEDIADW